MNFFYKAYSVIYLIVGWVMCRFMLLPAHSMKDVPDMLALIGAVIIIFSIIKNHNSTARMASLGYLWGDVAGMMIAGYIGAFLSSLMLFLPMLSVFVRRLHDTNHSGWWYFIAFVPLIGGIWLLVLLLTDSDEENEYGLPVY